ncbi:MAG: hypothetical protein EAX86_07560 [Candidatus Heimdallarchaeota archaeon]|nr:hypothetical protein [Candidatus Heimdallarchaeota archaeon]
MNTIIKPVTLICVFFFTTGLLIKTSHVNASFYDIPEISYGDSTIYSHIIFTGFNQEILANIVPISPFSQSLLPEYVSNSFKQSFTSETFFIRHSYEISSSIFEGLLFDQLNISAQLNTVNLTDGTQVTGKFINANDTLNWIGERYETFFGSIPKPGYSLIIANYSNLDDITHPNHWYNQSWKDPDTEKPLESQFMTGFGSQDRIYYIDLSTDSYILQDSGENGTLQELEYLYNFNTEFGLNKLAEYLAEWIYEIERNLFIQEFQYQPLIPMGDLWSGTQFLFETLVLCNISDYSASDLNWTINEDYLLEKMKDVYPWMKMEFKVRFVNLTDVPVLDELIYNSMVSWDTYNDQSSHKYGIDVSLIYRELYTRSDFYMEEEISSSFYTIHFKTFAFLFDNALFGTPHKAKLEPISRGLALRDAANRPLNIIGKSFQEIFGENRSNPSPNIGLSRAILQEFGHQLGLIHTFQSGAVGNFVDDVMAYYPYSTRFSIFSIDNARRGQIDFLVRTGVLRYQIAAQNVEKKVYDENLLNYFYFLADSYEEILTYYNQMNYSRAFSLAKTFYLTLLDFDPQLRGYADSRDRTEMTPVFFSLMLVFLIIAVYYRGKFQVFRKMHPRRDLLTPDMVTKFEEKARERFIASRQAAKEKFLETQQRIQEEKNNEIE